MYDKIFDEVAKEYDNWYETHYKIFLCEKEAIKKLSLQGLGLEVGIGTGSIASELGIKLGIDPSLPMLFLAKEKGIDVVRGFGEILPFKNEIFDFVLISTTLCFVGDRISLMKEVHRVLKRKGKAAVCFIPRDSAWGRHYIEKGEQGHRIYRHARFLSFGEIIELLETSGFAIKKIVSTLRFSPEDESILERPIEGIANGGFVCLEAEKRNLNEHK
jgi:ubiquinone/menaquinone biosynthesis C-methylase UbiE